jgi:glycerophosphoryl diester phosphodiesterase
MLNASEPWPYPLWIAHRGAGRLAPENTLAAFRVGASQGYRMFECDVKLSADGVPFLLHDDTLARTTSPSRLDTPTDPGSERLAGELPWHTLAQLDAGSWHSAAYAGEPLPTLRSISRYCRANGWDLNIEIKPSPGQAWITGATVALQAQAEWHGAARPPLLSSFQIEALMGAREAAPELPRAWLLDTWPAEGLQPALDLGAVAVVAWHRLWQADTVAQARAAGLRCLSYTVNKAADASRLIALGLDGLITDGGAN